MGLLRGYVCRHSGSASRDESYSKCQCCPWHAVCFKKVEIAWCCARQTPEFFRSREYGGKCLQLPHLGTATYSSSVDWGYRINTRMQYCDFNTWLLQRSVTWCAAEKCRCVTTGSKQSCSGGATEAKNCSRNRSIGSRLMHGSDTSWFCWLTKSRFRIPPTVWKSLKGPKNKVWGEAPATNDYGSFLVLIGILGSQSLSHRALV